MTHHDTEFGRTQDLDRCAGRPTHRESLGQTATCEEPAELHIHSVRTDGVATDDELAEAGLTGTNLADEHTIDITLGIHIGHHFAKPGTYGRQTGRGNDPRLHVGQGETGRGVQKSQGDLEKLLQGLYAAVNDDHAGDGLSAFIPNNNDLRRTAAPTREEVSAFRRETTSASTAGAEPAASTSEANRARGL